MFDAMEKTKKTQASTKVTLPVYQSLLAGCENERVTKLEAISRHRLSNLVLFQLGTFFLFVAFTVTATVLGRQRAASGACHGIDSGNTTHCLGDSLSAMAMANLITIGCVTFSMWLYLMLYIWAMYRMPARERTPELYWAIVLVSTVVLANNPLINLDRVEVFDIHLSTWIINTMAILRWITDAYILSAVTFFCVARMASFRRAEALDEPYPLIFYIRTVVPSVLLGLFVLVLSAVFRLEFSPQPIVSMATFFSSRMFRDSRVEFIVVPVVGLLQLSVLVSFFALSVFARKTLDKPSYTSIRRKQVHYYFFYWHTLLTLGMTILVTAVCSCLFPQSSFIQQGEEGTMATSTVLDLPYFCRAGVVLVYSVYCFIQSYSLFPAGWNHGRSRMEKEILERVALAMGSSERDRRLNKQTIVATNPRDAKGREIIDTSVLALDECILSLNLSWLCYISDDDSITEKVVESHGLRLRGVWVIESLRLKLLFMETDEKIFISFRGTVAAANWLTNLKILMMSHPPKSEQWKEPEWLKGSWSPPRWGAKTPRVHRGFYMAYHALRDDILSEVSACEEEMPGRRIVVVGHSMGGALATLCSFDIRTRLDIPVDRIALRTFGSPRVGNRAFTRRFGAAVHDSFRMVNRFDIVTNVPARSLLYEFEHVSRAVCIDNDGNVVRRCWSRGILLLIFVLLVYLI